MFQRGQSRVADEERACATAAGRTAFFLDLLDLALDPATRFSRWRARRAPECCRGCTRKGDTFRIADQRGTEDLSQMESFGRQRVRRRNGHCRVYTLDSTPERGRARHREIECRVECQIQQVQKKAVRPAAVAQARPRRQLATDLFETSTSSFSVRECDRLPANR